MTIYDDWHDLYSLILHPLALNLEVCVLTHLLCGLLPDVMVTWYSHIYDDIPVHLFLLNYHTCLTYCMGCVYLFVLTNKSYMIVAVYSLLPT